MHPWGKVQRQNFFFPCLGSKLSETGSNDKPHPKKRLVANANYASEAKIKLAVACNKNKAK